MENKVTTKWENELPTGIPEIKIKIISAHFHYYRYAKRKGERYYRFSKIKNLTIRKLKAEWSRQDG